MNTLGKCLPTLYLYIPNRRSSRNFSVSSAPLAGKFTETSKRRSTAGKIHRNMIPDSSNPLDGDNYTYSPSSAVEILSVFRIMNGGGYWVSGRIGGTVISIPIPTKWLRFVKDDPYLVFPQKAQDAVWNYYTKQQTPS